MMQSRFTIHCHRNTSILTFVELEYFVRITSLEKARSYMTLAVRDRVKGILMAPELINKQIFVAK
jgi:hypothetical protein